MTLQDLVKNVQMETKAGAEGRVKPADWLRWTMDSITEAFQVDGSLRIQTGMTVLSSPFYVDPSADPTTGAYDVPGSLWPYRTGLEAYIRYRYHSTEPKNADESAAAVAAYNEFLRCFGVK